MKSNSYTLEEFVKQINPLASELGITQPDLEAIARETFLHSEHTFLRTRPPVIAVTGVTHTGKSTLINQMFGEKRLEEGLTADTSDRIVKIRFRSGLLIYDTPGAGGLEVVYENRTRAFLGLHQLTEDLVGNPLKPTETIETVDAETYDPVTGKGVQQLRYEDFERPDIFLFIVDVNAGTLRKDDYMFFQEVASLGPPVIVIVNKIDEADRNKIHSALDLIQRRISRSAIPVSAKENTNIEKVIMQIIKSLPKEKAEIITQTINEGYKRVSQQQIVHTHSLAAAINTVYAISESKLNSKDLVASILGLYLWILNEYRIPYNRLQETGANFYDIARQVDEKLKQDKDLVGQSGLLVLAGTVVGGIAAIATGGLTIPLSAAIGVFGGFSVSGVVSLLRGIYRHGKYKDMRSEAAMLEKVVHGSSPAEAAASVYAFGKSIGFCCEQLTDPLAHKRPNFYDVFEDEYVRVKNTFRLYNDRLAARDTKDKPLLLNELFDRLTESP